jgi:hypothetical protein
MLPTPVPITPRVRSSVASKVAVAIGTILTGKTDAANRSATRIVHLGVRLD